MATKTKPDSMTAGDVESALRVKYGSMEWACLFNVANGTGAQHYRRCDAIAMSLWPSRGLDLHGHEIKVSRSDWLREIQDTGKAEVFASKCHYWWIVAPKGIVKVEELPSKWGLMNVIATGIRIAKPADRRESPILDYSFLAALLRASVNQSDVEQKIRTAKQNGYAEGTKSAEARQEADFKRRHDRYERLQKAVDDFQRTSGISITEYTWDGGDIGAAVKLLQRGLPTDVLANIESAEGELERAAKKLSTLRECLSTINGKEPK